MKATVLAGPFKKRKTLIKWLLYIFFSVQKKFHSYRLGCIQKSAHELYICSGRKQFTNQHLYPFDEYKHGSSVLAPFG
jgi:hypothetical protein